MGILRDRSRRSLAGTVFVRDGTIVLGTQRDILLSRTAADTLTLSSGDQFKFDAATTAITMTAGTILWGTDCKLYKRATGTIITDQALAASQGLVTKIDTAAVAVAVPDAIGHIHLQQVGGTARIVCSLFAGSAFYVNLTTWS